MDFKAYWDSVKDIPVSEKLEYQIAVLWLHPGRLPLGVVSIGDETMPVIKIPVTSQSMYPWEFGVAKSLSASAMI